jgi:hypothetical protein
MSKESKLACSLSEVFNPPIAYETGISGEKDKAFEWLEKAYEERSLGLFDGIKADPAHDPLRNELCHENSIV